MEPPRTDTNEVPSRRQGSLLERELTFTIIGCFFKVFNELGFGFLESVYRRAMLFELAERGLFVDAEVPIDVWYRSRKVGHFRADLLVDGKVIVEIKCSESLAMSDRRQLVNYLKATRVEVGLLLHFAPKAAYERVVYTRALTREKPTKAENSSSSRVNPR
jgi:GxxExxY protein